MGKIDATEEIGLGKGAPSELSFDRVANVIPGAVFLIDLASDSVVWKNIGTDELVGLKERDLDNKPSGYLDPVHPEDREVVTSSIERVRFSPQDDVIVAEYRMRHRSGEWLWIEARYKSFSRTDDGAVEQVLVTAVDQTEKRKMRAQLAQAGRLASVGTLAAGVAHEVNNPLTYVLFNLSHVKRELQAHSVTTPWAEDLLECLTDAISGANRVRDIVWDIKAFSSVREDALEPVDVNRAVKSAVSMANNQVRYRAEMNLELGEVPWVLGTSDKLSQVFLNLLLNAVQAIPEDGEPHHIKLTTSTTADVVSICIIDDGVGIPDEDKDKLFDPFFSTRDQEGSGLGLSICHNLVTALGGRIFLESGVGGGTVATVELPVPGQPAEETMDEEVDSEPSARKHRILVIDDDKLLSRALLRACSPRYDLVVANTGSKAVQVLRNDQGWALILCDLMMPGMSGMDVYDWIRRTHPELVRRVAFMTGGAFSPRARRLLESTSNPILEKPFDVNNFPDMVAGLIRRAKSGLPE